MGENSQDLGYVRANIAAVEGEFDAAAYGFFGDMAPLDDGLGGALEDGLAPDEEWPSEENGLRDDEDLPIEDLMDTEEDEDLSLAALLRKRMQQGEGSSSHAVNGATKEAAAAQQQHEQPLMPPMPPQPQMLSALGHQQQQLAVFPQEQQQQLPPQPQQLPRHQQQESPAAAAHAHALPPQLPDTAALDAVVEPPGHRTPQPQPKLAAQHTPTLAPPPSKMMTAEELEARMLRSAAEAQAPPPANDLRGNQLLSMLKGGAGPPPVDQQQQQRQGPAPHELAAAQQQMQHMGMGPGPMGTPPQPGMGPQQGMYPQGPLPPHHMLQQQQHGPGMMPPSGHPGGPMPPPEVLAQMQQQQQHGIGPPPPHHPQGGPMGPMHPGGPMGPGGLPPPFPGMGPGPLPGPMGPMPPRGMPPHGMMPPPPHHQQQQMMGMQQQGMLPPGHPDAPPPGPYGYGLRGPGIGPNMGPGMPPGHGPPMDPHQQQQQQQQGMLPPPHMRPAGHEFMQGPGQPPLPGQLMPPGGPPPFPNGPPTPQQPGQGPKQHGMPPPGFPALPAGMQQQQRYGSPGGMPGMPGMPGQMQGTPGQMQQQGQGLPPWAGPGGGPGIGSNVGPGGPRPPPLPQQQQQQGAGVPAGAGPSSGTGVFGGEYLPTATTASADAVRVVSPAALVHRLRTVGSTWMASDDINYILRIQHMATHNGVPYAEDFYFQAFCNKYFGARNAMIFAPQQLRDFGGELQLDSEPRFADLAGLGRVVLSNIRTPKMLMDVSTHSSKAGKGTSGAVGEDQQQQEGAEASKARPLEHEPMLAARIMVEDCMLLLCDVEDIDRMFTATTAAAAAHASGMELGPHVPGPLSPNLAQALLQRRAALLGGIAASFRLPDAPTMAAAAATQGDAAGAAAGDGVFVRILALPKGRSLITKTLKLMFTPPPAPKGAGNAAAAAAAANGSSGSSSSSMGLDVIWALLRNAQQAFGPPLVGSVSEAEKRLTDATIALAAIASEMVKRLKKPEEAVACLAAAVAGLSVPAGAAGPQGGPVSAASSACQLMPLYPAGRVPASASPEWLGSILGSLLLRASELGLGSFAAALNAAPVRGLGDGAPDETEVAQAQAESNGVPAAVSAEWQRLLGEFVQLVELHLWQLVQAVQGSAVEVAAAAGAGPGSSEVLLSSVPKMAAVPLMRVLMAHCSDEQQERIKGYLSGVGR